MTTLNAKANAAYHELIAVIERENPGDVWAGFEHERDAFETGWEAGYEAAPKVDREALMVLFGDQQVGASIPPNSLLSYRRTLADAVLALINRPPA